MYNIIDWLVYYILMNAILIQDAVLKYIFPLFFYFYLINNFLKKKKIYVYKKFICRKYLIINIQNINNKEFNLLL